MSLVLISSRLVLDRVGLICLQTAQAALLELSLLNDPAALLCDHALYKVDRVIEDTSVSLLSVCCALHGLDLNALDNCVCDSFACEYAAKTARSEGVVGLFAGHFIEMFCRLMRKCWICNVLSFCGGEWVGCDGSVKL